MKAKDSAQQKLQEKRARLQELYNKVGRTKEDAKEIKKLKKQIKHWQKQAHRKGETHSRTKKGN